MHPAELLLQCCLHIRRERLTHWCRWIHSSFVLDGLRVLAFSFEYGGRPTSVRASHCHKLAGTLRIFLHALAVEDTRAW